MLGLGRAAIDEIGGIGMVGSGEGTEADAEQAEFRSVGLAFKQLAGGSEDFARELRRRAERMGAGANLESRRSSA